MTLPILFITDGCGKRIDGPQRDNRGRLELKGKILAATVVAEACVALMALVLAILGVFKIIAMPLLLSSSLFTLSAVIVAPTIIAFFMPKASYLNCLKYLFCGIEWR